MNTNLKLISNNLYTAKYLVNGGKMNNCIIQITYGFPELLQLQRRKFSGYSNFIRDIIGSLYILNHCGKPVTDDVLNAFNSNLHPENCIDTGNWIEGEGWEIT